MHRLSSFSTFFNPGFERFALSPLNLPPPYLHDLVDVKVVDLGVAVARQVEQRGAVAGARVRLRAQAEEVLHRVEALGLAQGGLLGWGKKKKGWWGCFACFKGKKYCDRKEGRAIKKKKKQIYRGKGGNTSLVGSSNIEKCLGKKLLRTL